MLLGQRLGCPAPSSLAILTSGVSQESMLGPLLFKSYFNGLPCHCKNAQIIVYADDMNLFKQISSLEECLALHSDID